MAFPVTLNGRTYTLADFEGNNYVDGFPDSLEDYVTDAASKVTAAQSAQTAAESAQTSAESAQTSAESAQTAAESAQTAAETALDSFDDRYLGAKSSAPTLDNDGDALLTGAIYWNTTSDQLFVWDGSAWDQAYFAGSGFLSSGDNVSELVNDAGYLTSYTETDTLDDVVGRGATTTTKVTFGALVIDGEIEEQQYSLTGTDIDPANGTIQYKTLAANTTFTESLADGEFVTLMIDDGAGYTITWPTTTWVGGSAPTLETSGFNVIELWQVNGVLYGAFVGAA